MSHRTAPAPVPADRPGTLAGVASVLLGIAVTLVVSGYQFGQSNHSVYLIDALRKADPALLANDWFYTQTLQYHSAFGCLTAWLLGAGWLEAGFAAIYGLLLVVFHVSWRSIVLRAGGTEQAYLLSVFLYFISAGGIGLGTYQFFQDSAVLASNVANVALLAGAAAYIAGRPAWAGVGFGLAGLFHLNHAAAGCLIWAMLALFDNRLDLRRWLRPAFITGSLVLAALCAANVLPALAEKMRHTGSIPLAEFVDLYARLRHPHHYDPSSWPFALWLAFCFWVPWVLLAVRMLGRGEGVVRSVHVIWAVMALQLVALAFAGVVYVNETLVQMSLFRFSILAHLLMVTLAATAATRHRAVAWALPACLGVAVLVLLTSPFAQLAGARLGSVLAVVGLAFAPALAPWLARRPGVAVAMAAGVLLLIGATWPRLTGLTRPLVKPDPDYLALCRWAGDDANTPPEAVFLVPPAEEDFRWTARRAIVVNWKSVPQLAGELPEWRDRLSAALGWPDLAPLPRGSYIAAQRAIRERYAALAAPTLFPAAERYGARYVVAERDLGPALSAARVGPAFGRYLLYDRARLPSPAP